MASIIVAAAALFLLGRVEDAIATAEKRAALRHFQNEALAQALTETSAAYAGLDCVRDPVLLADINCRNDVESFISLLRSQQHLLVAVVPGGDFSSFGAVIAVAQEMRSLRTNDEISQDGPRLAGLLADSFVVMVDSVAAHFI